MTGAAVWKVNAELTLLVSLPFLPLLLAHGFGGVIAYSSENGLMRPLECSNDAGEWTSSLACMRGGDCGKVRRSEGFVLWGWLKIADEAIWGVEVAWKEYASPEDCLPATG